jgi:hypothetical protein
MIIYYYTYKETKGYNLGLIIPSYRFLKPSINGTKLVIIPLPNPPEQVLFTPKSVTIFKYFLFLVPLTNISAPN